MFVLGLDIGYSNVKLAFGDHLAPPTTKLFPAGAAPIEHLPQAIDRASDTLRVTLDGVAWGAGISVSKLSNWNRALHQDYTNTSSYRALLYAALLASERSVIDVLVTGLPVSQWQERSARQALTNQLKGVHQITPKRQVAVEQVHVVPQPTGAFVEQLFTTQDRRLSNGRVLVIDPGYFSVDWVLLNEGEIVSASSGTSLEAMSVLLDKTSELICDDHGGKLTPEKIEDALRSGSSNVLLLGQEIILQDYLAAAAQSISMIALEAMKQSLRREKGSVDIVLLAGGGASLYQNATKEFFPLNPIFTPSQPTLANALGFFYFGRG
ncbi:MULTISPECIES: ParM/StbA family protein [Methylomonas]|uniref:Actin-like protein N-terminal domain-containing protein n=1 Tax=Methylomonas koyamae TaxID=702114 RepID=A0AA91I767_9GAMM|nr:MULTISPECIES: ParM/StbA family protein [Methylomonas]ANE57990.1 hypothetical protein AYM39_22165 [Methylomonas sp. DH-1]OAI30250.1 hypothetical protein A1356_21930 [Methylomonas koyamae]